MKTFTLFQWLLLVALAAIETTQGSTECVTNDDCGTGHCFYGYQIEGSPGHCACNLNTHSGCEEGKQCVVPVFISDIPPSCYLSIGASCVDDMECATGSCANDSRCQCNPTIDTTGCAAHQSCTYHADTGNHICDDADASNVAESHNAASSPQQEPEQAFDIDVVEQWLVTHGYNKFGDAEGTMYTGGSPLFNEMTGIRQTLEHYLRRTFPNKPWNNVEEEMVIHPTVASNVAESNNAASSPPPEQAFDIDVVEQWLVTHGYNKFGDAEGTAYDGGDLLFNETTGEDQTLEDYLRQKFPEMTGEGQTLEDYLRETFPDQPGY